MSFRSRFWPPLIGFCAVILIFVGTGYLAAWKTSTRIFEQQRQFVDAGIAELRSRRVIRPTLFEPAEEGNSWDILKSALPFWKNSHADPDRKLFLRSQDGPQGASPEELNRVLDSLQPRIEILRQALRRRHVEPNHDYDQWEVPNLLSTQLAANVMFGVAEHLHREGRDEEALDHILIGMGLADHLRAKGLHISIIVSLAMDREAFTALKRLLAAHSLPKPSLERLARCLEILETSWPHPREFYRQADLESRQGILRLEEGGPQAEEYKALSNFKKPSWHDWFTERIQLCRLVRIEDRRMAILDQVLSKSMSEWIDAAKSAEVEIRQQETALIGESWGNLWWFLKSWGEMRMNLALARITAALALFQAENEAYPIQLSELVPKYLPSLIRDPYEDAEFGYWTKAGEATVVSRTREPARRHEPVGAQQGPEVDGFPAWRVKRK